MYDPTKITRGPGYTAPNYDSPRKSEAMTTCTVVKSTPVDGVWLHRLGVMVRISKTKMVAIPACEVALMAIELCRDIPAMRADLLAGLGAPDNGGCA